MQAWLIAMQTLHNFLMISCKFIFFYLIFYPQLKIYVQYPQFNILVSVVKCSLYFHIKDIHICKLNLEN